MRFKRKKRILLAAVFILLCGMFPVKASADEYNCAAGKHEYDTVIKDATETEPGSITYTCRLCGHTYTETIPAYGHDWGAWTVDVKPTCVKDGHEYRVCKKNSSHVEEKVLPKTGKHNFKITVQKATCTEEGKKTYRCTECGYTFSEIIPALGHDYGDWITDVEPSAGKAGHRYAVCKNDPSHVIEETIAALPIKNNSGSGDEMKNKEISSEKISERSPFNMLDYTFAVLELLIIVILMAAFVSQSRVLKWDRDLRRRKS